MNSVQRTTMPSSDVGVSVDGCRQGGSTCCPHGKEPSLPDVGQVVEPLRQGGVACDAEDTEPSVPCVDIFSARTT